MADSPSRSGCLLIGGVALVGLLTVGVMGGLWGANVLLTRQSEPYRRSLGAVIADPYVVAVVGGEPVIDEWIPHGEIVETEGGGTATFDMDVAGPDRSIHVGVTSFRRDDAWSVARIEVYDADGPVSVAEYAAGLGLAVADAGGSAGGTGSSKTRASLLVNQGREAYNAGKDAEAIEAFDLALEVDAANSEAWHWRGRTRVRGADYVGAVTDLSKAVEVDPKNAAAWEGLAWVRLHEGQDHDAIAALDQFLALRPGDGKALNDRANARYRTGDAARARMDAQASCEAGYPAGCTSVERFKRAGR